MAGAVQLAGHQPMDRPDWTNDRRFTAVADRSSAFSAPSTIRRSVSGLAHGPQIAKDRNDRWNASCTKDRPVVVFFSVVGLSPLEKGNRGKNEFT